MYTKACICVASIRRVRVGAGEDEANISRKCRGKHTAAGRGRGRRVKSEGTQWESLPAQCVIDSQACFIVCLAAFYVPAKRL